jgi:uncharacterized OB-fold protein
MDVRNCTKCGKIFNYSTGQVVCSYCKKELEAKFKETTQYIRTNPQASIERIGEECDVSVKQIKQWIREERLSFSKYSDIGIECEKCGVLIKTGRYCEPCKADTISELKSVRKSQNGPPIEKVPTKDNKSTGMHFIRKNR